MRSVAPNHFDNPEETLVLFRRNKYCSAKCFFSWENESQIMVKIILGINLLYNTSIRALSIVLGKLGFIFQEFYHRKPLSTYEVFRLKEKIFSWWVTEQAYYLARNLESYKSIIANFPSFNKTFDWKRYPKIAASNFLKHETSKAYAKSSKSCCLGWSEKRSNLADYHQLSELSSRGVLGFIVISVLEFSAKSTKSEFLF